MISGAAVDSFQCYSCIMDGAATDRSCMKNQGGVATSSPVVNCQQKYCTIIRQEYQDPAGQIYTFYRGCTSYSFNGVTDAGGFKVYTRVCTTHLCNNWDGISSGPLGEAGDGGGGGGSGGNGDAGGGGGGGPGMGDPGYDGIIRVNGTGTQLLGGLYSTLTGVVILMAFN
ncbi:PE-PGRS family protein PE_PGRS30-like isoform X2 [Zootermopsis nevadensis]|uniref:UPAR/Ly6 domain-containing protein n=1 Tax=Zootermopsis nevadensis TaxID=136037 RepID=A0A067RM99_ZOONE|nr:PE-PGRS family protein PE_PGRS30-like isoform X2 [Zootermopsis nevadensis]KDR24118.1 hypothetical protein L798_03773 [Zootermopsis nevadensis]